MTVAIRPTLPDEYRAAADAFCISLMLTPPNDEQWERTRPSWDETSSRSAWDGQRCVGHAGQFFVDTTVPGGARVPTAAVSRVGVLPSHRRQGIATRLMAALIDDAADRGLVLMSLRASEATIYERFGFGAAGDTCDAELDPARARPIRGMAGGSFRVLEPAEILTTVAAIYARSAHRRVGAITRPAAFWQRPFRAALDRSAMAVVVVHTGEHGDDGYALYETQWNDAGLAGGGLGQVHELFAADDATELALWSFICDVDLVRHWRLHVRPTDDLLRRAVADQRAYRQTTLDDEQWVRIVDVGRALSARTYAPTDGSVVVQVTDPFLPSNDGRWQISRSGAVPIDAPADLTTGIAGLSTVYLGGPAWSQTAAVGLVEVHDPGALAIADRLFATRPAPYCGTFF